ncbi:hypothetical protein L249_1087 [Ophiocordyceps polyrhachis-furcata BCC 54312]|uniref:Uncharacterized protein n=1 Tax=Ophiocordyceps polyrhachis-furcata BCC 54312 TaxID=1330021 RepID=A0A367LEN6_9HYPO|nr:hypothetical protein L249_1087 [Ophiocordyceps polyrhachis-furcata BCC 54312]
MLTRRLIVLLKKARLALPVLKRPCPSVTYGGLGPAAAGPASQCLALPPNYSLQPAVRRSRAVAASYVVVPFLPLLCNVRRPRAGCCRPGVTVSGAPAKIPFFSFAYYFITFYPFYL